MASPVDVETSCAEYEICICPFKQKQDHEDMNINVKSLVSIFEHEDSNLRCCRGDGRCAHSNHASYLGATIAGIDNKDLPDIVQCTSKEREEEHHVCRRPERVIEEDDQPVTLLAIKKRPSSSNLLKQGEGNPKELPKRSEVRDHTHYVKNKIVEKFVVKEKLSHDLRRCYSDSWGSYGLKDDGSVALLEALKDVIEKPPLPRGRDGKAKRIRLPKKPPKSPKPFREQVKDIFNPNKSSLHSIASSDSENDSEQSSPKVGTHGGKDDTISKPHRCGQGNYNILEASTGRGCPVCKVDPSGRGDPSAAENSTSAWIGEPSALSPNRKVLNIVLLESSTDDGWEQPGEWRVTQAPERSRRLVREDSWPGSGQVREDSWPETRNRKEKGDADLEQPRKKKSRTSSAERKVKEVGVFWFKDYVLLRKNLLVTSQLL